MKWINKHLERLALIGIFIAVLWVIFGPLILTQTYFAIVDFSGGKNNTGLIGETIGGITAPVVGLISAILLYFTLIKQIESSKTSVYEANFRIIYNELGELKNEAERYSYENLFGIEAIEMFFTKMSQMLSNEQLQGQYWEMDKFDLLLNKFNRIFYLLDNLKTSDEYKDFLSKDIKNISIIYLSKGYGQIFSNWAVSKEDLSDLEKGKMFMVKDHIQNILDDIQKRNPIK